MDFSGIGPSEQQRGRSQFLYSGACECRGGNSQKLLDTQWMGLFDASATQVFFHVYHWNEELQWDNNAQSLARGD